MGKEGAPRRVDARREFKAYLVPLGRIIHTASRLGQDEETQSGIKQAENVLHNEGLVLLDFHKSLVDIVVTSAIATEHLPIESFKGPVAASYFVKRFFGHIIERINEVPGVEGIPVIRKKDREDPKTMIKIMKKLGITPEDVNNKNFDYLERVRETVKHPYHAAMVAPFGTRDKEAVHDIKWGVAELLRTGCAALCTYTATTKHPKPFKVLFAPEIMRFNPDTSTKKMSDIISTQFKSLKSRV